jgi:Fe-S-cluster containining protein
MTLNDHLLRYLDFLNRMDSLFDAVKKRHGGLMPCGPGCEDCCNVYFDLGLIEAFYISGAFARELSEKARSEVAARSCEAESAFNRTNRILGEMAERGDSADVVEAASRVRIRCPLLDQGQCVLYAHRPATCRAYGTPQRIRGRVVTCPRTGFREGENYLTVEVDKMRDELNSYSRELLYDLIGMEPAFGQAPRYSLPLALRTRFDKAYFLSLMETLR